MVCVCVYVCVCVCVHFFGAFVWGTNKWKKTQMINLVKLDLVDESH
jgi:hypothetical protein